MEIPFQDWQFWVASAVALGAVLYILRSVLPGRRGAARRSERKATLTIGGKPVEKD